MASLVSAGLLMYTRTNNELKVFLVHPGGPYFSKKDDGYWGIPKGLIEVGEEYFETAKREFEEETGIKPTGNFIYLETIFQRNNKTVHAWAFETENDSPSEITSNTFKIEWPPRSGRVCEFPEVDRGGFFTIQMARKKIFSDQEAFIDRLLAQINK